MMAIHLWAFFETKIDMTVEIKSENSIIIHTMVFTMISPIHL